MAEHQKPPPASPSSLAGRRVVLRAGASGDVDRLLAILGEPEVATRWGPFTRTDVAEQFIGSDEHFVIELDGEVIGAIQFAEEDDPMYRHAGIDIFLTASRHGQGLGTDAIRDARPLPDRGARASPAVDRPGGRQRPGDPRLRACGVPHRSGCCGATSAAPAASGTTALLMDLLAEELIADPRPADARVPDAEASVDRRSEHGDPQA